MQLDLLLEEPDRGVSSMTATMAESSLPVSEEKAAGAFKTISEAAEFLDVPQHVLRFWEAHFKQIRPLKLRGGRRYYRPEDMETLVAIKNLLYKQGYTIKGAKKALVANMRSAEEDQPVEEQTDKLAVADTQYHELAAIREELIGLRDALKPHVF